MFLSSTQAKVQVQLCSNIEMEHKAAIHSHKIMILPIIVHGIQFSVYGTEAGYASKHTKQKPQIHLYKG